MNNRFNISLIPSVPNSLSAICQVFQKLDVEFIDFLSNREKESQKQVALINNQIKKQELKIQELSKQLSELKEERDAINRSRENFWQEYIDKVFIT